MLFNNRVLFVHVPKTGGLSLTSLLINTLDAPIYYAVPDDDDTVHPSLRKIPGKRHEFLDEALEVTKQYSRDIDDFEVIIAGIRNPYEMEISRYFYLQKGNDCDKGETQEMARRESFEHFAINSLIHGRKNSHYFRYYTVDGKMPKNLRIIRHENMTEEIDSVIKDLGYPQGAERLAHINATVHKDYEHYLTPEAEEAIYVKYRWIFDQGYYQRHRF